MKYHVKMTSMNIVIELLLFKIKVQNKISFYYILFS